MTRTGEPPEGRRRGENAISLENFGQRKGQVRALEEFRVRKEKKRIETAKALRKYKKAMKKEGMDAGRGASRKRGEPKPANTESNDPGDATQERRKQKSNPLQKSMERATQKKLSAIQRQKDREQNEKDRQERLRQRKKQTRLLSQRSKRGQPIMKHTVNNMLIKLQKMQK